MTQTVLERQSVEGGRLTDLEKLRRLPWYIGASLVNSMFCVLTFTGSVFVLLLSELGFSKGRIGLLVAVIPFAQMVALFVAPTLVRFGLKRGFLLFYGLRKFLFALLLLTPWVLREWGQGAAFVYVAGVIGCFGLSRGVAETALWSWYQQIVPRRIMGKTGAINTVISTVGIILTATLAGWVLGRSTGLGRFMFLITGGVALGILSLTLYSMVPGGAPVRGASEMARWGAVKRVWQDRQFGTFMLAFGLPAFALTGMLAFVPLYMKEMVGLPADKVVWLDVVYYLGAILTTYFWGWASDRYGSKPVMTVTVALASVLPVAWMLVPREGSVRGWLAAGIALLAGCAYTGWWVTSNRYLFVRALPREGRASYTAVFFAWWGLMSGSGPLVAGRLVGAFSGWEAHFWFLQADAYTPLFAMGTAVLLAGLAIMGRVQADGTLRTPTFVSIMFQGNPLQAFGSLVRHKYARDERNRMMTTERLGHARTLLSADELIEALNDPSFNVRHEAIIAIAHLPRHASLVDALVVVLGEAYSDLAPTAAWALGKIGDRGAIVPLREMLLSEYPTLRARSVRSLGLLGDRASIPAMQERLEDESEDMTVRVACAAALGTMRVEASVEAVLGLLYVSEDRAVREELALAAARAVSTEPHFIRLRRRLLEDLNTEGAQMMLNMRRALGSLGGDRESLRRLAEESAQALSVGRRLEGLDGLIELGERLPRGRLPGHLAALLEESAARVREFGEERFEYVVLLFYGTGRCLRYLHDQRRKREEAAAEARRQAGRADRAVDRAVEGGA